MNTDAYGLELSTASDNAAALYSDGVALMLSAWPGAAERLDAAIAADPEFALAHAARARLNAVFSRPDKARAGIAAAQRLAQEHATEREASHVNVLALAIGGRSQEALAAALAHADRWPRDVIVLGLPLGAFGLFAFSGLADHDQARVDLLAKHKANFDADDWWFLTYYGWALAENGEVARGRSMLEHAFGLRAANANGVHALAHAMFEGGAGEDADRLIASWLPGYDRSGILHGHIAWHRALVALERGDTDGALVIYDSQVRPSASLGMPINVVSDGASFLWRMQAYGHAVEGDRWREVADHARTSFPQPGHAFVDTHMAMIGAATGDAGLEERIGALDHLVAAGALPAGRVVPEASRAMKAFAKGDYAGAVRLLDPVLRDVVRIGGSGAQREVIEDTLLVALMRSSEVARARELLDRRLHRRPSPRDEAWRSGLGR